LFPLYFRVGLKLVLIQRVSFFLAIRLQLLVGQLLPRHTAEYASDAINVGVLTLCNRRGAGTLRDCI
jgi:hypothetical protein